MSGIHLLHFSDLHIGMENYGRLDPASGVNGRILDFLHRFDELIEYGLEHEVDLVIDGGYCGMEPTTVVDLADDAPLLLRAGKGDPAPFEN